MTIAQVEEFFERYAQAFSRFDVDAVCDLWAYPAYFAGRGKRASLDEEQFRANKHALCAFYKSQGMAGAGKRVVDFSPLTETVASVRTADEIVDDAGATIINWEHAYLVSETPDGLRAIVAMPDHELAAWRARGTPLGTW